MKSQKTLFTLIALSLIVFCSYSQNKAYTPWPGFVVDSSGIAFKGLQSVNDTDSVAVSYKASSATNVDLGILANVSNHDIEGVQLAALANVSNCNLNGLQLSLLSNYNRSNLRGAQITIFSNVSTGDLNGVQLAAYSNVTNGSLTGVQVSSFSNVALGNTSGAQISGFMNFAHGDMELVQSAGLLNVAKTVYGVQIAGYVNIASVEAQGVQMAGYFNYAPKASGVQLAGLSNFAAKENAGVQLSAFFNYAGHNKGSQLSLINYADSSSGVPFGFFSFVKKGYHVLEISGTETFFANAAFKTGVKRFYNIFETGFGEDDVQFGYGIGTTIPLSPKLDINLDLTASRVVGYRNADWENNRHLLRFTPTLNFQPFKKVGIAIGPSVNFYIAQLGSEGQINTLSDYDFASGVDDGYSYQAWVGGRLALRFF